MTEFFTWANMGTLFMLIALQCVLGFDNLLYISLESKKAPLEKQGFVRTVGIGLAIFLRIGLLLLLGSLSKYFEVSIADIKMGSFLDMHLTIHCFIFLVGGIFIIYTAIKEIWHIIALDNSPGDSEPRKPKSVTSVIIWIIIMNVVFSFDSILSAMVLTEDYMIMGTAIVLGGLLMIWLSGAVSRFLEKNKLYEVLGLFILLVVGIMLLTEGGHLAHMKFFGEKVVPMTKTTFYFVIVVLVLVDVVQGRYQKKIAAKLDVKKDIDQIDIPLKSKKIS